MRGARVRANAQRQMSQYALPAEKMRGGVRAANGGKASRYGAASVASDVDASMFFSRRLFLANLFANPPPHYFPQNDMRERPARPAQPRLMPNARFANIHRPADSMREAPRAACARVRRRRVETAQQMPLCWR
jgi:hypothetical protein